MSQNMNITDPDFQIGTSRALPEDEVQLWRVDLDAIRSDESRWQAVLSADESARAAVRACRNADGSNGPESG